MAEQSMSRMSPAEPAVRPGRLEDQQRRRNLRIAIRQLERAELYLIALYSLNLDDRAAQKSADDLVRDVRALHRHLVNLRLAS
jgi:hypothetical protein